MNNGVFLKKIVPTIRMKAPIAKRYKAIFLGDIIDIYVMNLNVESKKYKDKKSSFTSGYIKDT